MKVDFLATEKVYADWLQPLYRAMQGSCEVAHFDGTVPLADSGDPVVIAGMSDASIVPASRPLALVDHGVGSVYANCDHQSYNGGRNRERVGLFLYASPLGAAVNGARYPNARHAVVGPIRLDQHFLGGVLHGALDRPTDAPVTVGFAWHWPLNIVPETMTAFPYYLPVLERLAADPPWHLLGTVHPKGWDSIAGHYDRLGIESVRDVDDFLARCDLVCVDNSSVLYEAAALDRPTLALDAPHYRESPRQPPRFYDDVPGLRLMAYREQAPECGMVHGQWGRDALAGAIEEALDDRASLKDWRARVVNRVYGRENLDGKAAARAAQAVLEWAT